MRRGGRRVYAIDVSDKDVPAFKWKLGCNDAGVCDTGMTDMGQSWSMPSPAFIKGFSSGTAPIPALLFGGYDTCEDANARIITQCAAANDGTAIASFSGATPAGERSFAADVAMVDIDNDGYVDYAYAAAIGGGLWRINFVDNPISKLALAPANWKMVKIASVPNAAGRKFLFAPALLYTANKVYVAIGSGDREHPLEIQYPYSSSVQNRFYVFRDDLTVAAPAVQNLDDLPDASGATCSTVGAIPSSSTKGWYRDMVNGRGEQTVTTALIVGGMVAFSTNRPEPASSGTCTTNLGRAYGYWYNLFSGSGAISATNTCGGGTSVEFVDGGLPPSPVLATAVPVKDPNGPAGKPPIIVTPCFGCAPRDGTAAIPTKPVPIKPNPLPTRKRSYTYSSTD
jgi:type IV pilus assembly protein PilY1